MKTPKEIIGELAGYASLCWQPRPTGVFDSTEASKAVDQALTALREVVLSYQLKYGQLDMKLEREKVVYNRALEDIANLFGDEK